MNQRLTDKLDNLPDNLAAAKTIQDLTAAVVEVERLVLKSNYEEKQAGGETEPYETREFVVGEANTRGLSWKLNLFRAVADANFCKMVRVGIHGGNVVILGQGQNIDTALRIYDALVPAYERLGGPAFTEFSDGRDENDPAVNRTGWINQWLIAAPAALAEAIGESRAKDVGSNGKIASMVADAEASLKEYQASLTPPKAVKAEPKAKTPKAPKSSKSSKTEESTGSPEENGMTEEHTLESEDSGRTQADDSDEYREGDTAEEARADAAD